MWGTLSSIAPLCHKTCIQNVPSFFSCGKKLGYILYAYVLIATTQMEKEPFTPFEVFNVWGSTQEKFSFMGSAMFPTHKSFHQTFHTILFNSSLPSTIQYYILITFQFI